MSKIFNTIKIIKRNSYLLLIVNISNNIVASELFNKINDCYEEQFLHKENSSYQNKIIDSDYSSESDYSYGSNYSPGSSFVSISKEDCFNSPRNTLNYDRSSQLSIEIANQQKIFLSLDGGGIKGLMHLYLLSEIEKITKKQTFELFDGIVGTSIGGILAILLTTPDAKEPNKAKYSANDLLDFFTTHTGNFFNKKYFSFGGLFKSQYKSSSLESLLNELIKDVKISDSLIPVAVTTHDLRTNNLKIISSLDDGEDFYSVDACMATSAAPTYFKAKTIYPINKDTKNKTNSHRGYVLSDGGTCMNNPVISSFLMLDKLDHTHAKDAILVSFGTGNNKNFKNPSKLKNGGLLRWATEIADICIDGSSNGIDSIMKLCKKDKYIRINPQISEKNSKLDDISSENIDALFTASRNAIESDEFQGLLKTLQFYK